jgi:hypothetical protein
MTLDASGNLGIGTTSPNKRLTVAADDTTNTVNGSAGLQIVNTNAGAAGRMTSVTFGGRAPSNFPFAAIAGILESDVAQEQGGHLAFYTKSTTTAANPAERFRIDSTGNALFAKAVRATITTDNDLSFDMYAASNFKSTLSAGGALTFTNITNGQTGNIILVNGSNYAITAAATTKVSATCLATISATGTYWLSYYSDGTNVYVANTGALA